MDGRQCEVVLTLPNGRRYSAIFNAKSAYDAAVSFFYHCNNGPPELNRPKVDHNAAVEVRPIYPVSISKALEWAARPLSREEKKARQQR